MPEPMNRDYWQLDVLHMNYLIKPLVRAEVAISVAIIEAAVGSYMCTHKKVWLTKLKTIADLLGDWAS